MSIVLAWEKQAHNNKSLLVFFFLIMTNDKKPHKQKKTQNQHWTKDKNLRRNKKWKDGFLTKSMPTIKYTGNLLGQCMKHMHIPHKWTTLQITKICEDIKPLSLAGLWSISWQLACYSTDVTKSHSESFTSETHTQGDIILCFLIATDKIQEAVKTGTLNKVTFFNKKVTLAKLLSSYFKQKKSRSAGFVAETLQWQSRDRKAQ